MRDRDLRVISVGVVLLAVLTACTPDTITEVEDGENGTKVETQDDREWYFRRGIDCDAGDRIWECASRDDLLVEQQATGGRAGGGVDD